jgi:hypothetical protein
MCLGIAIDHHSTGAIADDRASFDDNGSKRLITARDCLALHAGGFRNEMSFLLSERESARVRE